MKPAGKPPKLDTTGLSAKAVAAIKAIKPTKDSEVAARTVATLASALTKADVEILAKAFERNAMELAKFSRSPAWQKLGYKACDKLAWHQKQIACALRTKLPERMVAFIVGMPASWPRTQLFDVLTGLHGAPPIGQKELAKLVDVRTIDRLDLYVGFEALYATDQKQLRKILRRPAKTWRDKQKLDIACDVIQRSSDNFSEWLPEIYPHVVTVFEVQHAVEGEAKDYVRYLAWAQKHADRKALAKYLRARIPEFYGDREWVATVKPALAAVAKKLDDAKLASLISNLDLD